MRIADREGMRIAIIGTISSSMVSFRGPLLDALAAARHQVFAFAIDYDEETERAVRVLGATPVHFKLDRTGTSPLHDARSVLTLTALLRRHRIELMLSYFLKPVIYGTTAAALARVRNRFALLPGLGYAFTGDDLHPRSRRSFRRRLVRSAIKPMLRATLALNERVFFYNPDDIEELTALNLLDPRKVERLNGTGVDVESFSASAPVTHPVSFLLAARLLDEKGIREYADAARRVKAQCPHVRIVLLGGEDSNPGAIPTREVRGWVEEGLLEWPGHVSDIRPWLDMSSVYVLPSYREGVPRSTQEAMAKGRPIITTDAPGCRETVREGENGFLVPVWDSEALADRMMRFVREPQYISRMGRVSRRMAEERFDVHAINRRILEVMGL